MNQAFTNALLDRTAPVPADTRRASPRRVERRFVVYRHNVAAGLAAALAARFPVVKRLVGEEFFRTMARGYAGSELPRSPIILFYGETFPAFIDEFAPARPVPYLGDIARIEMARSLACHAADATPLDADAFAALPADGLGELRVRMHPSLSVITSAHPIYSIWRINRDPERFVPVSPWASEGVLVVRPRLRIRTQCITHGDAAFIRALATGVTLAGAVDVAKQAASKFSASASLSVLIGAKVVVGIGGDISPSRPY
jgi:hypothetical protein